jgi:hypothetical protein
VQQECIPQSILGMDLVCQAKSGMGKTAVFVLATLQQIEPVDGEVGVIVLCHTRELAFQIRNEYARFSKYMPEVRTSVFYGGTPVAADQAVLKDKTKCPHIVVGTPGRMNALVRDKSLKAGGVKHFVLDECDKMLEQIGQSRKALRRSLHLTASLYFRHAPRRAGHLPRHAAPQAGHDVLGHALDRGPPRVQEVHAERAWGRPHAKLAPSLTVARSRSRSTSTTAPSSRCTACSSTLCSSRRRPRTAS